MTTTNVNVGSTMEVRQINIDLIAPPAFNSRMTKTGAALRKEEEKIAELAESMKAEGQQTPIEAETLANTEGTPYRYELVFGSRRLRAAKSLGWTTIAAVVKQPSSESERLIRNIVENEQRENLTTFEQARAYARMRDIGLKNPDIGLKVGKSHTHVSNLAVTYSRLPEPILKEWAAQHPVASIENLRVLADKEKFKTAEDQVKGWDDMVREAAEREKAGDGKTGKRGKGKGKAGSASPYSVVKANVDAAIDYLSPRKVAEEAIGGTKKWAYDYLMWILGQRKNPPEGLVIVPKITEKK